jgi:DNA adenine methylase
VSFESGYIGGKASAGVFHRIIGQMPPHSVYVEPFFGSGAVFWHKRRAERSILIDRAPGVIAKIGAAGREISPGTAISAICGDAISILPTLALPADAVVYCDPPYVLSTRKFRLYYEYEMTDADHVRLLNVLKALPCRVMLSGYLSDLYVDALQGWRCCSFQTRTRRKTVTEYLWCNFPEPEVLHDWRYAGFSYRQRLSMKRLAARWLARLERMHPRQRGYLLNSIQESTRPETPDLALRDPRADSGVAISAPVPAMVESISAGSCRCSLGADLFTFPGMRPGINQKENMSQQTSGRITGSNEHFAEIDGRLTSHSNYLGRLEARVRELELKLALATAPTPPPTPVAVATVPWPY